MSDTRDTSSEDNSSSKNDDLFQRVLAEVLDYSSAKPVLESIVAPGSDLRMANYRMEKNEDDPVPGGYYDDDGEPLHRPGLYGNPADRRASEISGDSKPEPGYQQTLERLFKDTCIFEIVRNHNQALDVNIGGALKSAGLNEKDEVTLVNFDAHSDLWRGSVRDDACSIAQWVNRAIEQNPQLNEVIWALPNNFYEDPQLRRHFFNEQPKSVGDRGFIRGPSDTKAYLHKETGRFTWDKAPENFAAESEKYRVIDIRKRPLSALPDLKGKNVILSTDLDGFDNRGFDTSLGAEVPWKGEKGFSDYLDTLEAKGVKPFMHLVSVSPEYLRKEHMEQLLEFAARAGDATKSKMDQIATNALNTRYGGVHSGIRTEREGKPSLQFLYRMFAADQKSKDPDGILELGSNDPEYKEVIQDARSIFKTDEKGAQKILENFDAKDGKTDGMIEFMSIEGVLVNLARAGKQELHPKKNPDALDE